MALRIVISSGSTTDVLSTAFSILALVISTCGFFFAVYSWRSKSLEDARKAITEAIAAMIGARQKLEELRASGEKYGKIDALAYRIALTDQRQIYLSRALQIVKENGSKLALSDFDYMMLAANLMDLGRTAESVTFYEKCVQLAANGDDRVGLASARRVYGRAMIAAGRYDEGREVMLAAMRAYQKLADERAYDRDRMNEQAAETYRRLIWVELQAKQEKAVLDDAKELEILISRVEDRSRRDTLEAGMQELKERIKTLTPPTDSLPKPVAPTVVETAKK